MLCDPHHTGTDNTTHPNTTEHTCTYYEYKKKLKKKKRRTKKKPEKKPKKKIQRKHLKLSPVLKIQPKHLKLSPVFRSATVSISSKQILN